MKYTFFVLGLVIASGVLVLFSPSASGQAQLLVGFDFEGEVGNAVATDKSGFGTPTDALLFSDAAIINDAQRGNVLQTGASGLGAATLHDDKLEVTQSYTLSAWVKTSSPGIYEHIIGRAGVGPRIMNHWGLGGVSFMQMVDNTVGFPAPDFGDEVVNFGPGGPPGGDGEWHHMLVTWNHDTREFWGYYDGDTGPSGDNGAMTNRQTVVTHEAPPGLAFQMGGDPNSSTLRLRDSLLDDVAFWRGYATPEVAQGLFDGTYTIFNAPIEFPGPGGDNADFNGDGDVDGADFLTWQRNLGVNNGSAQLADGDANGDSNVNDLDLGIWKTQFGTPPALAIASVVPEPTSGAVLLVGTTILGLCRRRRTG